MNTTAKRIIGIVAIVAIGALACSFSYQAGSKSATQRAAVQAASAQQAKEVASNFITAITAGRATQALSYGSAFYKTKNTTEDLQAVSDKIATDNVKIVQAELYPGQGDVTGQAIYLASVDNLPKSSVTGTTTGSFVVRLVFEDGIWRVDSMQVS